MYKRRITKPWAGRALPIPKPRNKEESIPPDSNPTPIVELGWRELHARFQLVASRLESHAFVLKKHPLKIDIKKSRKCEELAKEVKRISERITKWPSLSGPALAGEKSYTATRYIELICEAQRLMDGKVL